MKAMMAMQAKEPNVIPATSTPARKRSRRVV